MPIKTFDGFGVATHRVKQNVTGSADNKTLVLGAALPGYQQYQEIISVHEDTWSVGILFYWLEANDEFEYGYGQLFPNGTFLRENGLLVFSSTGSRLALGTSDTGVLSVPPNPLCQGVHGAKISTQFCDNMIIQPNTSTTLTWTRDCIAYGWETLDIVGTNELVLPDYAQFLDIDIYLSTYSGTNPGQIRFDLTHGYSTEVRYFPQENIDGDGYAEIYHRMFIQRSFPNGGYTTDQWRKVTAKFWHDDTVEMELYFSITCRLLF